MRRGALVDAARPLARPLVARARRRRSLHLPLLAVVMPVHDGIDVVTLERSTRSVLDQTLQALELVLVVEDGDEEARLLVEAVASQDRRVRVVSRPRRSSATGRVGEAAVSRNAGVAGSKAPFLAFCDADDTVPPSSYERMVASLRASGSDLVVGAVTLQEKGRHLSPAWLRLSNPSRRQRQTLRTSPGTAANHLPGARVVRRSSWTAAGLRFDESTDYGDPVTMTAALRAATAYDVLPAVVYHWHRRTDDRSLVQLAERDGERAAERVRHLAAAADLLREEPEALSGLHRSALRSVVAELVRAAMANDETYWRLLGEQVRRLDAGIAADAWHQIGFEDRALAWLCAEGHRDAAAEFLMYAFDNQQGFPFDVVDGQAHVTLPMIDDLARSTRALTLVAEDDHVVRARLAAARWGSATRFELQGLALVEYWSARHPDAVTRLVLVEEQTGLEVVVPTTPVEVVEGQTWAGRGHEDHSRAGFAAVVDTDEVSRAAARETWVCEVLVEHEAGGRTWRVPFQGRDAGSSAALLETGGAHGDVTPVWRRHEGLRLRRQAPGPSRATRPAAATGPAVDALRVDGARLHLGLDEVSRPGLEVALVGPRSRTDWVTPTPTGEPGRATAELSLRQDDWGLGAGPLPSDPYDLLWRAGDGSEGRLRAAPVLWRLLPLRLTGEDADVLPRTADDGSLVLRVWPREWATSRAAYDRRQLRDVVYPAARQAPLLDTVLFETFAGKAGGDNPGALCQELLGRPEEDLDLVFSVIDRSVVVPEGVRTVVRFSQEYFELLGRARYLLVNASLPYFFRKREGQLYFQTWHGSPLKRIAHDRPHLDFFNWHHRRQLLLARDGWDYLLSQSAFCTASLSSAFRYAGAVMEVGYPRNDVLVADAADDVRRATRERLGLADSTRVVLYAPTWRDNQRQGMVFEKVLYLEPEKLVEQLGDCVVLVRGHYNSIKAAEQVDVDRRVIDVTRYPDISHLYLAADALVTDYSSVFFDFALVDRPMVFLAPDLVAYRDDNRGFYLDYHETVPGPVCETTEEVAAALLAPDTHGERRAAFREQFAPLDDGSAAARVVDAVLEAHPYR